MSFHSTSSTGAIHIPYNFTYANASAREADTSVASADIGKLARQTDDNTLWMLVDTTPTWVPVSGSFLGQLDGYASDVTVSEHYAQLSGAIQTIIKDLDGYSTTDQEHYVQLSDAVQSIVKDLDGYALLSTEDQRWIDASEQLQGLRNAADGYAALSTENQRWSDSSEQLQGIRDALDGYASDTTVSNLDLTVSNLDLTVQEHKEAQGEINDYILVALDGYASDTTVSEHYVQHSLAIQTILKDLDGYALSASSGVDETTFQENKRFWNDAIHAILKDLDGYAGGAADGYILNGDGYVHTYLTSDTDNHDNIGDPTSRWREQWLGKRGLHIQSDLFYSDDVIGAQDAYLSDTATINIASGDGTNAILDGIGTSARHILLGAMVHYGGKIIFGDQSWVRSLDTATNEIDSIMQNSPAWTVRGVGVNQANGEIYLTRHEDHKISKWANGSVSIVAGTGSAGNTGDGGAATSATLNTPWDIAGHTDGSFYISDRQNNRIRKVDSGGTITNFAGQSNGSSGNTGDGGAATSAALNLPTFVKFDPNEDYLYIVDSGNKRIRRVDMTTNVISHFCGDSGGSAGFGAENSDATSAALSDPGGICFDGYGNTYIVEAGNSTIKKVDTNGKFRTVAGIGSPSTGFSGDGGDALDAELGLASHCSLEMVGTTLYVGQSSSVDRIRQISFTDYTPAVEGGPEGNIFRDYHLTVGDDTNNFIIRDGYGSDPETIMAVDPDDGYVGFGTDDPTAALDLQNMAGTYLKIIEAGVDAATEEGWIRVDIGGTQMYLRGYGSK